MEPEPNITTLPVKAPDLDCDCILFEDLFPDVPECVPFPDQYTAPDGTTYRAVSDTLSCNDPFELRVVKNMCKTLGKIKHIVVVNHQVMTLYRYE